MPTTYQTPETGVNPQQQPQPGYYAIIPASVRYCKGLPPNAKLLYGEITALCAAEGYSWAANSYFANLYEVDDSTVRRWLAALVKEGFIKVFVKGPKRRIYLAEAAPKQPKSRAKTSGLPAQKQAAYPRKNERHSITLNSTLKRTSEDVREGLRFVGPGPVTARQLREQTEQAEQKEPASPGPTKQGSTRKVERALAAVGDLSYRGRFLSLWEVVEASDCGEVWQSALDAAKSPRNGATGLLGAKAGRFCAVLASGLHERGVSVPESLLSACGLAGVVDAGAGASALRGGEVAA